MNQGFFQDKKNFNNKGTSTKRTLFGNSSSKSEENSCKQEYKSKNSTGAESAAKNVYEKYSNMPQADLMKELLKEVQTSKANGTFDAEKLESSINSIAPMLNKEQVRMMKNLLGKMK